MKKANQILFYFFFLLFVVVVENEKPFFTHKEPNNTLFPLKALQSVIMDFCVGYSVGGLECCCEYMP